MSNFKKLVAILAPMIAAGLLVVLLLYGPLHFPAPNQTVEDKAALSLSPNVLRGDQIKDKALDKGYLMIMGSSELSRFDSFHPAVLAQKYERGYHPFLLGAPGTQSLTHFFSTQAMGKHVNHKKVVVIISPQWFVPTGVDANMFDHYYSKQQATYFVNHVNPSSPADRYAAQRLLAMPSGQSDDVLAAALKNIAHKKQLTSMQRLLITQISSNNLRHQDQLFTRFLIRDRRRLISERAKSLPTVYNYQHLDIMAESRGREHTTNNDFGIANRFYSKQLQNNVKGLKNSQTKFTYEYGPEYSDFQLLLNQFKQHHVTPLFIITPINGRWQNYTGLRQSMLNNFDKKINFQLRSQGFTHIADLHQDGNQPYFMQDTIHLGWRGWLHAERQIHHFVQHTPPMKKYQLNDYFYSKSWQQRNPQTISSAE